MEGVNDSLLVPLDLDLLRVAVLDLLCLHFHNLVLKAGISPFQNLNPLFIITAHLHKFGLEIITAYICEHFIGSRFIKRL